MTWNTNRRRRLPKDWEKRRRLVLQRDPFCRLRTKCNGAPSTEVDHIVAGDDHRIDRLQGVCTPCHLHKTATERPRIRQTRPTENHPGLL